MAQIPLVIAVLTTLVASLGDGAFVGIVVVADGASLSVRADSGEDVTFLLDRRTDMPAGFVTGTRVLVRFEVLAGRRYRAVSVSPPRIPLEAGVLSTLPSPEPGTRPPSGPQLADAEGDPFFMTVADPGQARAESIRDSVPSVARAVAHAWVPPSLVARASFPVSVASPQPLLAAEANEARPPEQVRRTGLLAAMAILLAASAILAWLAFRLR